VHSDHRVILVFHNLARQVEAMQVSGVTDLAEQPNSGSAPRIVFVTGKAVSNPHGATVYQDYCSACHGVTARGNGPAARLLQRPAPDLTRIAVRDGAFHQAHVIEHIKNVGPRAVTPMPCWGQELKSVSHDPTMNWLIVSNLAGYLGTLQAER
jgi:mono/diheme cytochrome c family protein